MLLSADCLFLGFYFFLQLSINLLIISKHLSMIIWSVTSEKLVIITLHSEAASMENIKC